MRQFTRKEILSGLKEKIVRKEPVVACSAGAGIIAKAAQKAGIDLLMADSKAQSIVEAGASLAAVLPYIDSNAAVAHLAKRLLPITNQTPVVAGIGATDPYRSIDNMIGEAMELGYSGISNMPTVGVYGESFCKELETSGYGYSREVSMIEKCRRQDIFTAAHVFTEEDIKPMVDAGSDVVIADCLYLNDATTERMFEELKNMTDAALKGNRDIIVLLYCRLFSSTGQVQQVLDLTGADGIFGASAIERIPAVDALKSAFDDMLSLTV